ncbi:MAG: beta-galactosidase [Actinomycetota bacterium]|nr:beta-galactosidase [Actinomycetota bacterium]
MIETSRGRIVIDGVPRLLMSGEVHYFRLAPTVWAQRLDDLIEAGCTVVASYIPWLWHELPDRSFDFTGRTHPQLNLTGFLDLCAAKGLGVIARPGPFVMAELKNEGLPHRLYEDHPEIVPITWDGRQTPTRTVDYLAPAFLSASREWYAAVMPVLAERLRPRGGPVIGVQLDNEVGMLPWVTNSPDLTDLVLDQLADWVLAKYPNTADRYPVDLHDKAAWATAVRSPAEAWAAALRRDLGEYTRARYANYFAEIRQYAHGFGIAGVPFLINVHGTDQGRGRTFPIGISQLYQAYSGIPGIIAGSDHYLGDLTLTTLPDLYVINAFMGAVNGRDQPITSLEFEAGSGDYDETLAHVQPPESIELKTRLSVAQGNRLINYYLFSGGHNPMLHTAVGDGNDRIAFTGERHGFAAPVGPEGVRNETFGPTAAVVGAVCAVGAILADSEPEYDDLTLGFVPDHYLTEYRYPGSQIMQQLTDDLEEFRGSGPRDILARAMVLSGLTFRGLDLQLDQLYPVSTPALALGSPSYLDPAVQQRLLDYVRAGGRLLLSGLLPRWDLEGRSCTVLADGLGVTAADPIRSAVNYFPSVVADGWAGTRTETRVTYLQRLRAPAAAPILRDAASGDPVAVMVRCAAGSALLMCCDFPCLLDFWTAAFDSIGVRPRVSSDPSAAGLVVVPTVDSIGQRIIHLVNVVSHHIDIGLHRGDQSLLGGRSLRVAGRSGLMLPENVRIGDGDSSTLRWATGEIAELDATGVTLRFTQDDDVCVLTTTATVAATNGATVHPLEVDGPDGPAGAVLVHSRLSARNGNLVRIDLLPR